MAVDPFAKADCASLDLLKRRDFSLVLILSPPAFHALNIEELVNLGFTFPALVVEKPLVQTVQEFETLDSLGTLPVATVTPWRLSFAATFLRHLVSSRLISIEELNIIYGEQYRWPLTRVGTDNTCFTDLGPHFFDMATYILNSHSVITSDVLLRTNSFSLVCSLQNCPRVTLSVSREHHRPSSVSILDNEGCRTTVSLAPGTDSIFTESALIGNFAESFSMPQSLEADSLFANFYSSQVHNDLFSPYQDFRSFLDLGAG